MIALVAAALVSATECKLVKYKSDCNYCSYTECTDGKTQWVEGGYSCTAMSCPPKKEKYDPKFWKKEK